MPVYSSTQSAPVDVEVGLAGEVVDRRVAQDQQCRQPADQERLPDRAPLGGVFYSVTLSGLHAHDRIGARAVLLAAPEDLRGDNVFFQLVFLLVNRLLDDEAQESAQAL